MSSGFFIETVGFGAFIHGALSLDAAAEESFLADAQEILAYAKANAPWTDRTGNARNGLDVDVYHSNGEVVLDLFHTVDYGQWLETIQSGDLAIIMPTLERFAAEVFQHAGAKVEQKLEG